MSASTHEPLLAGVRVLDFTRVLAGPYCTRLLADQGAAVIKVERPGEGDEIRHIVMQLDPGRTDQSSYFVRLNVGKRGIAIDLTQPTARDVVLDLVKQADVLVENFAPGVMAKYGLDHASLAPLRPDLVYCSISGFGQTGPDAHRPAYAQIVQAASGWELANAGYQAQEGDEVRPASTATFVADVMGGLYAFSAILAALQQRHATGRGQHIDSTLMEGMLNLLPYEMQEAQFPARQRRHVYPPFRASDGWLMIAAVSCGGGFGASCSTPSSATPSGTPSSLPDSTAMPPVEHARLPTSSERVRTSKGGGAITSGASTSS